MKASSAQIFIVLTALVLTSLNFIFFSALWQYFMINTFDLWYKIFNTYPIFEQTMIEIFFINLFPIVVAVFLLKCRVKSIVEVMISFCYAYMAVLVATFLGSVFSVFLFGRRGIDPLLPYELRKAPFPFYWLLFVALGIVVVLMLMRRKVKMRNIDAQKNRPL